MKRRLILLIGFFVVLAGCSSGQTTDTTEAVSESANTEVSSSEPSSQESNENQTDESLAVREDNVPVPWTDYSNYAEPNEEGYAYYIYNDPDISSEVMPMTEASSQDVLLFTFDDAPQMPDSYAIDIAEILKSKDVNAIFLVNGMYLDSEEGQEITRTIHEMGFEIGNHTETHPNLRDLTYEEQYTEIKTTNDKIEAITGLPVRWFRPPFGSYNYDTIYILNELGLQLMNWSFGFDWMDEYLSGPELAEVSLNNDYLRGGANILMHDRYWTRDALPTIIDGYREMGYHIVDPYLIKHQRNSEEPLEP